MQRRTHNKSSTFSINAAFSCFGFSYGILRTRVSYFKNEDKNANYSSGRFTAHVHVECTPGYFSGLRTWGVNQPLGILPSLSFVAYLNININIIISTSEDDMSTL